MRGLLLLLCITGLHAYSVDDPQAAHTDQAIEYDSAGGYGEVPPIVPRSRAA